MSLPSTLLTHISDWLDDQSPCNHVVVSSRARYARNLHEHPFSPHAPASLLERVREEVQSAFNRNKEISEFFRLELPEISWMQRGLLKE